MTMHVNIGEAKTRLSELVAAAIRGEEVWLAKAGARQVRLVPAPEHLEVELEQLARQRQSAFGMYSVPEAYEPPLIRDFKMTEAYLEKRYRRKFGPPD